MPSLVGVGEEIISVGGEMKERAVVDRFEEESAILLVGPNERRVKASRKDLPAGVEEGQWLKVELGHGRLLSASLDEEASEAG